MKFELTNLGSWSGARLLAEFDPESSSIRVDAAAYDLVRVRLGFAAAEAFVTYAVAHERFHALHPGASEAEAHAFARERSGVERSLFEDVLRG